MDQIPPEQPSQPELPKPEPTVPAKLLQIDLLKSSKGTLKQYLSGVLNLNESGVFLEPTCMFCRSKTRTEAESLWRSVVGLANNKEVEVRKLFLTAGEDIPLEVIRHHIKNHLDRAEAELRKVEAISKISALNDVKVSTLETVQLLISACWERMMATQEMQAPNAATRHLVESQKTKDITTIMKTMNSLLQLQASILGEMQGRGELISIPVDKFKDVFAKRLLILETKEEKKMILGIMEELTKANAI